MSENILQEMFNCQSNKQRLKKKKGGNCLEKLDLTHSHISGEILPAVTFLDGSMVLYSKMKNVFPSTQELALGS